MARMIHMLPTLGVLRSFRRLLATAIAATALAIPSLAAAVDPVLVDPTPGASGPAGAFRDTNDTLWIADHAGLCRLDGVGQGMTPSPYCDPTGLVGVVGPVAPGQAAYDPAGGFVYIGDGASSSGGVWRFQLGGGNPAVVVAAERIVDFSNPLVGDRVFGMSYQPAFDRLDFSTKNSPNILRIDNPAACPPVGSPGACVPQIMGSAIEPAAASLAHDVAGNLYIADLPGVTRIANVGSAAAQSVPGMNLGAYSALAYDAVNGLVYAGTTNPEGVDWVDAFKVSTSETVTYSVGFDGVTAVGVTSGGDLDVMDDPGIKQVGEDLGGTARRFTVPYTLFAPAPTITSAPQPVGNGQAVTFGYSYPSTTSFFCTVDQAPASLCGSGTQGITTYTGVGHGSHTFQVIADNPVNGPRTIRRFTIDTRAPVVQVDAITVAGQDAELRFSADDLNVDFICRLDSAGPGPCDSPARYSGLANGLHTVTISATDFVGNVGAPVSATFRVGPEPPPPWKPGKLIASLRRQTLVVSFTAPPGAKFARITLTKKGVYPVRSKIVGVVGGKRNVITVPLAEAAARRLQGNATTVVKVLTGANRTNLAVASGTGRLKITQPLRAR